MAWYGESKVYNDGSHYIAIPHTTRLVKKRPKPLEELITVEENNDVEGSENVVSEPSHPVIEFEEVDGELVFEENEQIVEEKSQKTSKKSKKITKKEYFNELYSKYFSLKKNERKKIIIKEMLPYFDNERQCKDFVERNFERKLRNLCCKQYPKDFKNAFIGDEYEKVVSEKVGEAEIIDTAIEVEEEKDTQKKGFETKKTIDVSEFENSDNRESEISKSSENIQSESKKIIDSKPESTWDEGLPF